MGTNGNVQTNEIPTVKKPMSWGKCNQVMRKLWDMSVYLLQNHGGGGHDLTVMFLGGTPERPDKLAFVFPDLEPFILGRTGSNLISYGWASGDKVRAETEPSVVYKTLNDLLDNVIFEYKQCNTEVSAGQFLSAIDERLNEQRNRHKNRHQNGTVAAETEKA